jgi:hypothetical protein
MGSFRNTERTTKRALTGNSPRAKRLALDLEVVWGDITHASGDLFMVGHYQDVLPQNAELALDCAISKTRKDERLILTDFTRRGVVRGALGDAAFFPWGGGKTLLVAGMGRHGSFRVEELRRLTRSAASSVGRLLDRPTVNTVLIGSGDGNLDVVDSVSGILGGFGDAIQADPSVRFGCIRIVERSLDRAIEILQQVKSTLASEKLTAPVLWRVRSQLAEEPGGLIPDSFGYSMVLAAVAQTAGLPGRSKTRTLLEGFLRKLPKGEVRRRIARGLAQAARRSPSLRGLALQFPIAPARGRSSDDRIPTRISYFAEGRDVFGAAITNSVTVVQRRLGISLDAVDRAVERLRAPELLEAARYGQGLGRRLIPGDFVPLFEDSAPLVVEVDRPMARVQWEMIIRPAEPEDAPVAIRRPIARQLRTTYSPRPADIAQRPTVKALVIGDPRDDLPDARDEAQAVYQFLKANHVDVTVRIGSPTFGKGPIAGVPPADLDEVIELLLSGEFDLVHYAGHAKAETTTPGGAGWVFKDGLLLNPAELESLERPPMLVVANACDSAILSVALTAHSTAPPGSPAMAAPRFDSNAGEAGIVASLADEFFRRGVADYIGTAWEVPSEPATTFAKTFYEMVLGGPRGTRDRPSLGVAVRTARKTLYDRRGKYPREHASVWGAYQHYGDPTRKLDLRVNR